MKKTLLLISAFLLVVATIKAQTITTVSTASELATLATEVNSGTDYSGKTVTLTKDIELATPWMPIGTSSKPFQGTFDGQGHKITNLEVDLNATDTGFMAGLFGHVGTAGCIKDLTVSSLTVQISNLGGYSATCFVGAIAGQNQGTIVGCANKGVTVYGNQNNANVGGIVGKNMGSIENCYNLGRVYTGSTYTYNNLGGIVGENTSDGKVSHCFVRAEVSSEVAGSSWSGAICGNNPGAVTGCFYMNGKQSEASLVLVNATSNDATLSTANGETYQKVLLADRTIYSDGAWNTLCLPFSIPATQNGRSPIAGATVKELDSATSGFNASTGVLTINFTDVTSIEAGKPYIVKWDEAITDNLSNPLFLGVTINNQPTTVTTSDGTVDFKGIFSPLDITEANPTLLYLGDKNLLYYPDAAMTIGYCRAYFQLKTTTAAKIRRFELQFEPENVTSITLPISDPSTAPTPWYDLSGRRLDGTPSAKGIYINNGKIFIIHN